MKGYNRKKRSMKFQWIIFTVVIIGATATLATSGYIGSEACVACHQRHGVSWEETLHSRFMRPLEGDHIAEKIFLDSSPVTTGEVTFVLGNMNKLTLLKGTKGNLSLIDHQYDLLKNSWEPFNQNLWDHRCAGSEGSVDSSGNTDWYERCAGCHTTGYDSGARTFVEPGIGCESCHGPGAKHTETSNRNDIINPAALPEALGIHICAQCHSRGSDKVSSKPYPVGYTPGEDLEKTFILDEPIPGTNTDVFWENGVAKQHHAQFNEERQSKHFQNGVLCFDCHNVHRFRNTEKPSPQTRLMAKTERYMLRKRAHFICLSCHEPSSLGFQSYETNGEGVLIDKHTRHPAVVKMSELQGAVKNGGGISLRCADCHMPSMSYEGSGYDMHAHTFRRVPLSQACLNCHATEDVHWVSEQLKSWAKPQN